MSGLTHPNTVSGIPEASRAARRIQPRPDGPSERLAPKLRRIPSLIVSWIVADVGAFLLAGLMIGLGFLTTEVLLKVGGVSNADERFPHWLATHRTAFWDHWSYIGSMIGDAPVLIPLAAAAAIYLVFRRRWRTASFVVQAGLAEGSPTSSPRRSSSGSGRRCRTSTTLRSTTASRRGTSPRRSPSTGRSRCC
jgi:hypothetical protein